MCRFRVQLCGVRASAASRESAKEKRKRELGAVTVFVVHCD